MKPCCIIYIAAWHIAAGKTYPITYPVNWQSMDGLPSAENFAQQQKHNMRNQKCAIP